jgi:hypothetical protein
LISHSVDMGFFSWSTATTESEMRRNGIFTALAHWLTAQ